MDKWYPIVDEGITTSLWVDDESTSGSEFLNDRGYVYSEDGENSKWSLKNSSGDTNFTLTGDFYILIRAKFGTLNTGTDQLFTDKDGTSNNFCRIQDHNTIRFKIAGGSNRNVDFDTNTFVVDTWYNIELQRTSGTWIISVNGEPSEDEVSDSGAWVLDRFFAISDGHVSDIFIKSSSTLTAAERTKLRNWMDRKGDLTWEAGGLTT